MVLIFKETVFVICSQLDRRYISVSQKNVLDYLKHQIPTDPYF